MVTGLRLVVRTAIHFLILEQSVALILLAVVGLAMPAIPMTRGAIHHVLRAVGVVAVAIQVRFTILSTIQRP